MAEKQVINKCTGEVKKILYSTAENLITLKPAYLDKKHNTYVKKHLERDGKSVKAVEDGICDIDAEIQSEVKNAGLQNILKLQEMRYGTLENAIARANDRGVYADVSKIPETVGERAEFVAAAKADLEKLKADLGLSDADLKNISYDKLIEAINAKNAPQQTTIEGDAE